METDKYHKFISRGSENLLILITYQFAIFTSCYVKPTKRKKTCTFKVTFMTQRTFLFHDNLQSERKGIHIFRVNIESII